MNNISRDKDALLRLADTKLVLGNVCIATVFNGRSLGDFATLLAIAGTSLGATRALYRLLEAEGKDYVWLERGRNASEIASAEILDAAPESWAELMVTIFLTEAITSAASEGLGMQSDRLLANQARMIARDSAFHMAYCLGWLKTMSETDSEAIRSAVSRRLPLAMLWVRQLSDETQEKFLVSVKSLQMLTDCVVGKQETPASWDTRLGRASPLPPTLWELVRFKDEELVQ